MSLKSGQLILVAPDCNEKPLKTNGKVFRIGSYLSCDLVLDEPDAKRIHCEIQSDAFGRISITNHSKRNPVLINGVPVKGTRPLYSGSFITIFDKKLKWLNKQRVGRDDAPVTNNENDEAVTTPKMIRHQAEQAPNSEPSLLVRKKAKSKRITMHALAHNMDMESDDDFPTVNDENDDEFQENLTKISMKSAMKNSGATPPRLSKRMSKVNNRRTINSPTSQRLKTLKEESSVLTEVPSSPKVMLLKCKSSGMVVTSYSPTTTPNKTPKSFARVVSNKDTPPSTYGTPRSVLSELNAFDEIGSSPKTPLSFTSMHLIDFTTPDVFKTPLQKKITPLFKSALRNSAAKSSLKSGSISKPNFTLVEEESSPSPRKLNTPKSSANKIRWESPNSLKKIEGQLTTPKKTASVTKLGNIKSLETPKSSDKRSARKSASRLAFAATETPPELVTKRQIITSNTNTPLRSSANNSPAIRKSMNRSISTPLKTPKAIFLQNDADKKDSKSIMENCTPKRHSSYSLKKAEDKNSMPNILLKSSDKTNVVLTRSATFILDEPTVSRPTQNIDNIDEEDNTEKPGNGTFTCEEDFELNDVLNEYSGAVSENTNKKHEILIPILEEEVKPISSKQNSAEINKNELSDGEGESRNLTDLNRTPKNVKKHEKRIVQAIKNDLSDVEGVKHLFSAQSMNKTPIFRGIRELVQTPKYKPEENLIGIKELVNTPKANSGLDNVRGMKELFNTPNRDDLSDLLGVKELLNTPKENVELSNPTGMKELFNTPMRDDLTDVYGVKELVNTPNLMAGLDNPKGLKELFNTPMRDDLTNISGVKELMKTPSFRTPRFKTPKVPSYEDIDGLKNIFKTPASGSVMILGTPKSIEVKKNLNLVENLLKTPCELDLGEDMEDVDEIYNSPVSKFIDYPEEEEINDQTNEKDKNLSPEETFDKLVGKPTVKRTYGRTTMTPSTRSMNTTRQSLESCVKTDIQEWIDNVHNSYEHDEKLCEDFIPLSTKSTRKSIASFDNSSPSIETNREPLAASSSIKPGLRRSPRNTEIRKESIEVTEMSGIEQLDNTINSESDFSGVLIYSEASNDEASTIDVDAEESKTPKRLESRVSKINTHTPQKCVQFNDSVIGTLKMTPQIRRIRGRIATPHSAKYSLHAVQKSPRGPFNDLSIQFIDESSVIESETGRNTSCYRISQSRNGSDISVKLLDQDGNSTDNATGLSETIVDSPIPVNDEHVQNISIVESFSTSMKDNKSKRKSRKVVNENGCVIFISDDEECEADFLSRSNFNETDTIQSSDTPLADRHKSFEVREENLTPKFDLFNNSRRTSRRIIDKSMGIESNLTSNISMKSGNLSAGNGSVKVISFNDTNSYEAEEDKLLDLYEFEVSKDNIANKTTELVYISSEDQHEDTQNIKTINELISTVKEHPMNQPLKVSKLKRQTIGHKPAELNPINTRLSERKREFSQSGDASGEEPEDIEKEKEPILSEEFNDSATTLWKSVAMNISENSDLQLEDNNLETTEEEVSDISFESCSEIESNENEFENFSENPTTELSRVKSLTPDVKKRQKRRLRIHKTLGSVSRNSGAFDYKGELDRRNMSLEFKNFELNGPKNKSSRGRSQNFHKTQRVSAKNRMTVGESPLSKCFNYEAELERRNMSLQFENFETEAPKDKVLRARSQSPENKVKKSDKNRRTIGKDPLIKSFDYKTELDRRKMSLEFQNFELEGKISTPSRGRSLNTEETKRQIDIKRHTVGQNMLEESFDYEAELKRRNMSLEFQNFDAENPRGNAPRGRSDNDKVLRARSQSPEKKVKTSDKNRRTIGKAPLSKSFDYKAELDRRKISMEFQNFKLEGKMSTSSRGRSLNTQETKRQIDLKRLTVGQTILEESFDYEAELKRRNMSLEFQNFEAENPRGNAPRGRSDNDKVLRARSQSPEKKVKTSDKNRRTIGKAPLSKSFDYKAELDRRKISMEFQNFKLEGKMSTSSRGRSLNTQETKRQIDLKRLTVGQNMLEESFDYEAELKRRNMSLEFQNFDAENPRGNAPRGRSDNDKVLRARSQSPEKKVKTSDKNRRTIGKAPLSKSFDYKAELDRRKISMEFQNFKLEGKMSTSSRGRSLNTQETKRQIDLKRLTVGQTILEESFDYEAELKRRNMSLEFQNFEAENPRGNAPRGRSDNDKVLRARSQSPEKKVKTSDKNRRTIGKAPLSKSFDYKAELDRRKISMEFQNFKLEGKMSTSSRGRSLNTQETKRQIDLKRLTVGQTILEESFDYEAELKRRNMSLEFQNFDAENPKGNAPRGRSESPQKKPKSTGRNRRTVGENVLEDSFNYDYELDRRNMSLDFANFKNSPQLKTRRGYSMTTPDTARKPDNCRRTVGHKSLNDPFDYEVEKNRRDLSMAFEKFEEKPQLKTKRGDSISSVAHTANRQENEARKTMGFQTEVTLDIEYEKNKLLEDQKLVEPNIEEESTSSDTLGNEIKTNKKRILFSHQINEDIINVTQVKNYEVTISDDKLVIEKPVVSDKSSTKIRTRLRTNRIPTNYSEIDDVIEEKPTRGKRHRPKVVKDTEEILTAEEAMDASRHVHFGDNVYYEIAVQITKAKDETKSENATKKNNKSKKTSEKAAPTRSTSRSRKAKTTQEKSSDTEINTDIIDEKEKTENVVEDIEMNNDESAKSSTENEVPKKTRAGRRRKASDDTKSSDTMIPIKDENYELKDPSSEQDVNEADKSDVQLEPSVTKARSRRGKKVEVRTDQEIDTAIHSVQPAPKSAGRRGKKIDETVAAVVVNLEMTKDMEENNRTVENNPIIEVETIEKIEQKTTSKSRARRDKSIEDPPLTANNDVAAPKTRGRRGRKVEVTDKISEDNKETESNEKISLDDTEDKKAISRSRTRQPKAADKILVQTSENISLPVKTRGRRGKTEDLMESSKDSEHFEIKQEIEDPVKQPVELPIEKPASKSNSRRAKKASEPDLNSTPVISNRDESSNSESIQAEDNAIPTGSNLPAIPKIAVENVPTRARTTRRGRQVVNSNAEESSVSSVNQEKTSTIGIKTLNAVQPGLRITRLRSASIDTSIKNQRKLQENLTKDSEHFEMKQEIEDPVKQSIELPIKKPASKSNSRRAKKASEPELNSTPVILIRDESSNSELIQAEANAIPTGSNLPAISEIAVENVPTRARATRRGRQIVNSTAEDSSTSSINQERNSTIEFKTPNAVQPGLRITRLRSASIDTPIILQENLIVKPRGRRMALETSTPKTPKDENNMQPEVEFKTPIDVKPLVRSKRLRSTTDDITPIQSESIVEKVAVKTRGRRAAVTTADSSTLPIEEQSSQKEANDENRNPVEDEPQPKTKRARKAKEVTSEIESSTQDIEKASATSRARSKRKIDESNDAIENVEAPKRVTRARRK